MASDTVYPIDWSHPPPSCAVPPERLVHSINQCTSAESNVQPQHGRQPPCLCGHSGYNTLLHYWSCHALNSPVAGRLVLSFTKFSRPTGPVVQYILQLPADWSCHGRKSKFLVHSIRTWGRQEPCAFSNNAMFRLRGREGILTYTMW